MSETTTMGRHPQPMRELTAEELRQGYAICGCGTFAYVFRASLLAGLSKDYAGELCRDCGLWVVAVEKLTPSAA